MEGFQREHWAAPFQPLAEIGTDCPRQATLLRDNIGERLRFGTGPEQVPTLLNECPALREHKHELIECIIHL